MFLLTPEEIEEVIVEEQIHPDPEHSEAYQAIASAALRKVDQELFSPCQLQSRKALPKIECPDCLQKLRRAARLD